MQTPPQPLEYRRIEPLLTPPQRKILLYIKKLHDHPPTLGSLLQSALPRLILSLAVFGGVGALGWYLKMAWVLPFACGAAYIAVIVTFRLIQQIRKSWAVQDRVINRDEVDRLLAVRQTQ